MCIHIYILLYLEIICIYILELALYASAYNIARLVRRCLWSKVHRTRWSLTSDLDTASVHLLPNCLVVVLTKACSKKSGFHRGCCWPCSWSWPLAPVCRIYWSDRASCIFLISVLNLAPSSNLGHINQVKLRGCFWCCFWTRPELRACF